MLTQKLRNIFLRAVPFGCGYFHVCQGPKWFTGTPQYLILLEAFCHGGRAFNLLIFKSMSKKFITKLSSAVEGTPGILSVNVEPVKVTTKTQMKDFADVIRKADHAYSLQMEQTCSTRLKCIEFFAKKKFTNMNLFWTIYMQRADVMLDSISFRREAKKLGQDPVILATNIVARGAGLVKEVSKHGIAGSGIRLEDYCCAIVPDEILRRFTSNPEEFLQDEEDKPDAA